MPLNWATSQLRDLADVRVSNVDKKSYAAERPIRLCNYMDVYANDYLTSALLDFMPATASPSEIERFALHAGDVVITKDSETPDDIGVPAVIVEDIDGLVCGYHLALIRPKASVHPTFLAKQLASAPTIRYFAANATGSTRFGLAIGTIEKLDIPTPPIAEQAKIAEVLSTPDRAIEQTEALIAKQQRIKTGLMQDLLTRGIDEHGDLRSEQTHKFKDSPLGRIPVEWEVRSLGQCVRADAPICYGILMPGQGVDNGVPVIKVKDIVGGRIVQDNLLLTDRRIDRQYRRSRLRSGDLVITIRGTTGRLAVVPPELDGANITQDTARLRLSDYHSARFCFYCLQSESAQGQIALHTIGQAVNGINIGDVKRLLLGMPSLHEQERLANRFEGLEKTTYATSRALAKLKSTKAGLMQDLLTGNRRVTALLEQSEEVTT